MTEHKKHAQKIEAMHPDFSDLPARVDREMAAELLTKYFFRVSARSLERWPLAWRRLNGKAHVETRELFPVAGTMLSEAPIVMGGRRPKADAQIAA